MNFWPSNVASIQPSDPVSASVVNKPLSALTERTNYLRTILDNTTSGEFLYSANRPIAAEAVEGNILYWDSTRKVYAPTLAAWSDALDSYGALMPAPSAQPVGVLVSKLTSTTGAIVLGGILRDFTSLEGLFGSSSPSPGMYYLSAETAGKVVAAPPPLGVLAVVLTDDGSVILPTARFERSTHDHKRYLLDSGKWLPATHENFPSYDIPDDAEYGYNRAADSEVDGVFTLYPGIATLTDNVTAENIPDSLFLLDANNIWWLDAASPVNDVDVWLTQPNSHGPGIVRAIATNTTDELSISLVNGLATVDMKDWVVGSTSDSSYTVLKSVDGRTLTSGPVVEQITAGPGISIISSSDSDGRGVVSLGLSDWNGSYIDASVLNLNNAMQSTVDNVVYMVFPSGRASSMSCVASLPEWSGDDKVLSIWAWVRGLYGGIFTIPALTASVAVFPQASSSGVSVPSFTSVSLPGISSGTYDKYYLMEVASASRVSVSSGAQIQYILSLTNSSGRDVMVLKQGVKLYSA